MEMIARQFREESTRTSRITTSVLRVLITVAVVRFWLMPLHTSFWTDETGTFWTIKDGLRAMFARIEQWPNTSPLFGIIAWLGYRVGGRHEYALRLPSVLAMAVATWLLSRLAMRLLGPGSALSVVAVFISLQPVILVAAEARPYALVLALGIGATLALVGWLDTGKLSYGVMFVLADALVMYAHLLAFPVILVHGVYAVVRISEGTAVRTRHIVVACLGIALLVALMIPGMLHAAANVHSSIFAGKPYLPAIADDIAPSMLVMGAGLGILAGGLLCYVTGQERLSFTGRRSVSVSAWVLILALVLVPPGLLFAISSVTPIKVFVSRYFILSNAGLALLVGWGIAAIQPESVRSVMSGTIIACSIGAFGSVGHIWPLHHNEDWRGAMAEVRQMSADMPVIFQSPFVESGTMLRHASNSPDFLTAPFAMYPVPGHVITVPRPFNAHSIAYLNSDVVPEVKKSDRFVLVTDGPEGDSNPYIVWLLGRFPEYSTRNLGDFGESLRVTLFTRRDRVE